MQGSENIIAINFLSHSNVATSSLLCISCCEMEMLQSINFRRVWQIISAHFKNTEMQSDFHDHEI